MSPHIRKQLLAWSGLYSLLLLIASLYLYQNFELFRSGNPLVSHSASAAEKIILDENDKILSYSNAYKASGEKDLVKFQELKYEASLRKNKLLELLKTDPMAVRDNLFTQNEIASFPPEIQDDIEKPAVHKGTYMILHADDFDSDKAQEIPSIETEEKEKLRLYTNNSLYFTNPQSQIQASGMELAGSFLTNGAADSVEVISSAATAPTLGNRKLAVILINFSNNTSQPETKENIRKLVFANTTFTMNSFIKESSFQKAGLTGYYRTDGDVYGWYTVPYTQTEPNYDAVFNAADTLAARDGFNASLYDNVLYYNVSTSATAIYRGAGYIGGKQAWISIGFYGTLLTRIGATTHELGHNFGTHHASSLKCTNASGVSIVVDKNCITTLAGRSEYGDPYGVMGNSLGRQYNNYEKSIFGWIDSSRKKTITLGGTTTVNLVPLEFASGINLITIPLSTNPAYAYYLEYRQPYGWIDDFATSATVVNGVSVRLGPLNNDPANTGSVDTHTFLLDTTPSTSGNFSDASLAIGKEFYDADNGIRIKTVSVNGSYAQVSITKNGSLATPTPTRPPNITVIPATPVPGSVVHQQTVSGGSSSSNTLTSASITGASGNVYIASVSTRPNIAVSSIKGLGLTWTKMVAQCAGRAQTRVEIWKGTGTPTTGTVTATLASSATNAAIAVSRYAASITILDPQGRNTVGANGACSGGTDTSSYSFAVPTGNSRLLYVATALRNRTFTPGAGFIERVEKAQGSSSEIAGIEVMDTSYSGATNTTVAGTLSGTSDWAVGVIELNP